jgi:metal-responsive CopG/Arc/MetJ family transcriptional regulator
MAARIRIDPDLYRRVEEAARRAGYSSTEEFVRHVLEREVAQLEERAADEEVEKQLRGLGYIE